MNLKIKSGSANSDTAVQEQIFYISKEFNMKLKSIIAAAALAVLGVNAFAATNFTCDGILNGSQQQCGSTFSASGAFASSINFGNATGVSAFLTDGGANTFQYLHTGTGSMFSIVIDSYALGGTLPAGNWGVFVNGLSGAYQGGVTYNLASGLIPSFSPSPVPEPESYAMMLAGLAALGTLGRRRKAK